MWGRPFVRTLPGSDEQVAVFVLDTQGMFDSETSQMMTAAIFGLSTLISSYQVRASVAAAGAGRRRAAAQPL
jgi:atlastin